MEPYLPYVFLTGLGLLGLGFVVLLVVAFRTRWWWGLLLLVFPPLALLFVLGYPRRSVVPATVLFLGVLLTAGPPVLNRMKPIDLGPLERTVDGELHLTLTGWDRKDYSALLERPHAVVLQMANPDVDDLTLGYLAAMDRLRELDLNGTKVTDAGAAVLGNITTLETLRLRDTKVTDEGFRKFLAGLTRLRQIDLRGTGVSRESVRAWKDVMPGRRALQ